MSQENVELVRKAIEAFKMGDVDRALAPLAPDFEYIATGMVPGAEEVYRGPEGWRQFLELFWDEFDEADIEVHELLDAGDHVLAVQTFRGRGKQSRAETSWDIWQLWTMRDGKAVRGQGFTSREEALKAAGLAE